MSEQSSGLSAGRQGNQVPNKKSVVYRIDDSEATPILIMAGFFDIISFIPIANSIIVFIAQPFFFFSFLGKGVNTWGPKNWVWNLVVWIIELIPGLSFFPGYTIECMRWIAISRIEDKIKATTGFDADSAIGRASARKLLEQKKTQDIAKNMSKESVRYDAKRAQAKGGDARDAIRDKRAGIADARKNLDSAVGPDAKNASSGFNQTLGNTGRERARKRDERLGQPRSADDPIYNTYNKFSGVTPAGEQGETP